MSPLAARSHAWRLPLTVHDDTGRRRAPPGGRGQITRRWRSPRSGRGPRQGLRQTAGVGIEYHLQGCATRPDLWIVVAGPCSELEGHPAVPAGVGCDAGEPVVKSEDL